MKENFISLLLVFFLVFMKVEVFAKSINKKADDLVDIIFLFDNMPDRFKNNPDGTEVLNLKYFNKFLEKRRKEKGKTFITVALYDDEYGVDSYHKGHFNILFYYNKENITKTKNLTWEDYSLGIYNIIRIDYKEENPPFTETKLLDAIEKSVRYEKWRQDFANKDEKANKVLFIIISNRDKAKNKEYSNIEIKELIENQIEKDNWNFLFLGTNDAIETAKLIGIDSSRAANYKFDSIGLEKAYKAINTFINSIHSGKELKEEWKIELEKDYNKGKI